MIANELVERLVASGTGITKLNAAMWELRDLKKPSALDLVRTLHANGHDGTATKAMKIAGITDMPEVVAKAVQTELQQSQEKIKEQDRLINDLRGQIDNLKADLAKWMKR